MELNSKATNEWRARPAPSRFTDFKVSENTSIFRVAEPLTRVTSECSFGAFDTFPTPTGNLDRFASSVVLGCSSLPNVPVVSKLNYQVCQPRTKILESSSLLSSDFALDWRDGISFENGSQNRWLPSAQSSNFPFSGITWEPSFDYYESLAKLNVSILENQRQQNVIRLADARAKLNAFELKVQTCLKAFASPAALGYFDQEAPGLDLAPEEVLEFLSRADLPLHLISGNEVLNFVLHTARTLDVLFSWREKARHLRVRISSKILSLTKLLDGIIGRFCSLSWARRSWFLLHGSHPPKTEHWHVTSQSFGCAWAS